MFLNLFFLFSAHIHLLHLLTSFHILFIENVIENDIVTTNDQIDFEEQIDDSSDEIVDNSVENLKTETKAEINSDLKSDIKKFNFEINNQNYIAFTEDSEGS